MILELDTASAVPPFEQIRSQIEQLADDGTLPAGTRLPTIRQLAGDLGIAPGTVARAYRELEANGVVVSRVRHGTTVAARPQASAEEVGDRLCSAARAYAVTLRALGVDRRAAIHALDDELALLSSP